MTGLFFYEDDEGRDGCLRLTLERGEDGTWRVAEIEHVVPESDETVAAD